jgi:hypothetical protein
MVTVSVASALAAEIRASAVSAAVQVRIAAQTKPVRTARFAHKTCVSSVAARVNPAAATICATTASLAKTRVADASAPCPVPSPLRNAVKVGNPAVTAGNATRVNASVAMAGVALTPAAVTVNRAASKAKLARTTSTA